MYVAYLTRTVKKVRGLGETKKNFKKKVKKK